MHQLSTGENIPSWISINAGNTTHARPRRASSYKNITFRERHGHVASPGQLMHGRLPPSPSLYGGANNISIRSYLSSPTSSEIWGRSHPLISRARTIQALSSSTSVGARAKSRNHPWRGAPASLTTAAAEPTKDTYDKAVEALQQDSHVADSENAVAIIRTRQEARKAVDLLLSLPLDTVYACDTETTGIDPKKETPIGHGRVICLSVYCGRDVDFSACSTHSLNKSTDSERSTCLWVDTMGEEADAILEEFRRFLEDETRRKCWHNYSFDKHMLANHKIRCKGFAGDTMHMARLWDSSRGMQTGGEGYSLEALSVDLLRVKKTDMMDLFGKRHVLKDGTLGKTWTLADTAELQKDPDEFEKWVHYSARDTKVTWFLYQMLAVHLRHMEWNPDPAFFASDAEMAAAKQGKMFAFYETAWREFGELLTDIEARGIYINQPHLKVQGAKANADAEAVNTKFLQWAEQSVCPDAIYMNAGSVQHRRQLFFGMLAVKMKKSMKLEAPPIKVSAGAVVELPWVVGEALIREGSAEFAPSTPDETLEDAEFREFSVENTVGKIEEGKKRALKNMPIMLRTLKLTPTEYTATGLASTGGPIIKILAGKPKGDKPKYGTAYDTYKERGRLLYEAFKSKGMDEQVCVCVHVCAQ